MWCGRVKKLYYNSITRKNSTNSFIINIFLFEVISVREKKTPNLYFAGFWSDKKNDRVEKTMVLRPRRGGCGGGPGARGETHQQRLTDRRRTVRLSRLPLVSWRRGCARSHHHMIADHMGAAVRISAFAPKKNRLAFHQLNYYITQTTLHTWKLSNGCYLTVQKVMWQPCVLFCTTFTLSFDLFHYFLDQNRSNINYIGEWRFAFGQNQKLTDFTWWN